MTDVVRTPTAEDRRAAHVLWRYNQMDHQVERCDAAIVLGCHDLRVAEHAARLYHKGLFPVAVFSGARSPWFPDGEAYAFGGRAIALGVPAGATVYEPDATNTGANIEKTRHALGKAGITVGSVLLVSMPYMQRRGLASCQVAWPEVKPVCSSEQITYNAYVEAIGDEVHVIDQLVGDTQRVIVYPHLGFATEQQVSEHVHAALDHLIINGYTSKLLADDIVARAAVAGYVPRTSADQRS